MKVRIFFIAGLIAACGDDPSRRNDAGWGGSSPWGEAAGDDDDHASGTGVPGSGDDCDGCACTPGEVRGCWPGDPKTRGVGACRDGEETCTAAGTWGACEGAVLPSEEIPDNCIDESCNGFAPGCTECLPYEICGSGQDDDCNGLADCDDPTCDCECTEACVPGTWRYCDEPKFCAWGRQDCAPDGTWGACIETDDIPPQCEDDLPFPFPVPTTYDPQCCVAAGHCCQNYGADPSLPLDASIGDCDGVVELDCSEPYDPQG